MDRFFKDKITQNIIDAGDGRILRYNYDEFLKDVVKGNCCFICGASPDSKPFNNEHVVSNWILKAYGSPGSFMVLPNQTTIKNTSYTVPCCRSCNSELGELLEIPISKLLKQPFNAVNLVLQQNKSIYLQLFHWVCLLFFKTHLKGTQLSIDKDLRKNKGKISDSYCWHPLYHIHNISRQHHSGVKLASSIQGSLIVFEALVETETEEFDYLDNWNSQVVMVKVGQIVVFAVLDDSRFCISLYKTFLSKINGPLNSVQIREIFARLRYASMNLKRKPRFYSFFGEKGFEIKARVPNKIEILRTDKERVSLFELMAFYIGELMPPNLPDRNHLIDEIKKGQAQYIFDEHYNFFIHKSYRERLSNSPI